MSVEWLHWYYLIYVLPAAVAVLVLLMTGLGGHHGGHSHAGHGGLHLHAPHGGAHGGVSAGHTAQVGAHGHSHSAPGAHSARTGHHGHAGERGATRAPGFGPQLLGFFGVGRAPLTIVIGSLMIGWGVFGLAVTDILRHDLRWPPALVVGPALAAAAAGSLLCAKLFGELSAKLLPKDESYAIAREGLLGLTGTVVYPVSETGGRLHVFDQYRTLHVEPARVSPGQAPIEKGTEVVVASMDLERGHLIVEPLGFTRSAIPRPTSAAREENSLELRNRTEG